MGAVLDEVVRPDVIRSLRLQANTGPVGKPKTAAFWLLMRNLQPLTLPDPLDPAIADRPAGLAQQSSNLAVAVAAILARQLDDIRREPFSILSAPRDLALRRAMLPERRTGMALGDIKTFSNMLDAGAPTRGA